jgi:hypothetical protein
MKIKTVFLLSMLIGTWIAVSCGPNEAAKESGSNTLTEAESAVYVEKGKVIAGTTFSALSSRLQAAMKEGGVPQAIAYCNLNAYPLTDSLAKANQAEIRRTSLLTRNPENAPNMAEKVMLDEYAAAAGEGKELKPQVVLLDDETVAFYAPIKVNAFCLQCHGKLGENLTEENYAIIKENYPDDQAIGYLDGDLRGMWSIKFQRDDLK